MSPKTILSIFDYSGEWTAPFWDAGHNVIQLDIKHDPELADVRKFCVQHFLEDLGIDWVDAIIAAPPCTDFTNAGAQYWKRKDIDGRTEASVFMVEQVLRCVEFWKPDWWVLENPIGRLPKLVPVLGKPKLMFNPCDFAGYVCPHEALVPLAEIRAKDGENVTAEETALIMRMNAYTKKTALWGNFELPELRRVEPVKACKQGSPLQRLGGKSEKTKAARSHTPEGFAIAFHRANEWTSQKEEEFDRRREAAENEE